MSKKTAKNIIDKKINDWTDEECLIQFSKFFDRVDISSQFIKNEDDLFTHQILVIACGEKVIVSDPQELEWPLQMLPMPEAFKERLN